MLPRDPVERAIKIGKFFQRVELPLRTPGACWRWRGAVQPGCVASYAYAKERGTTAARVAWAIVFNETLPRTVQLRRTCGRTDCVNPAHGRVYRSKELALEVRRLIVAGAKQKDIAATLGLPLGSVGRLAVGVRRRAA